MDTKVTKQHENKAHICGSWIYIFIYKMAFMNRRADNICFTVRGPPIYIRWCNPEDI